jgi:hexosaminidase
MVSNKYEKPIRVVKPGVFKFRSFHPVLKPSEISSIKMYKKGLSPTDILWHSKQNEKYKGVGDFTLINNKKASLEFSNPQWLGVDSIASATVFFKKVTYVKSINIGYLCDAASWIFPPERAIVSVFFKDGTNKKISKKNAVLEKLVPRTIESFQIPIGLEVISLKIEVVNLSSIPAWHEGKGLKAWLFMDEWIFN